ncbi:MAG: glycoside hydrolase family 92 protein [Bacteroidales bacterium]
MEPGVGWNQGRKVILEILKVFYTSLYHSFLAPVLYSDSDGRYRGADGEVYIAEGFKLYSILIMGHQGCTPSLYYTNPTGFLDMINAQV